jgi:ABC-2 type transport system ATP-binding protein
MNHAIELDNLRKDFSLSMRLGRRRALDGLSLSVRRGEIFGFLGPNGAGKTTSIKILVSLLRQDSGTATIYGAEPARGETRQQIGYLPESPTFYDHLTGREFLAFCGRLCGLRGAELRERSDRLLEQVGLAHAADLQIRRYSKGMNQRVGIAQALLHDPELVILDEPMSGLDPIGRAEVRDLILDLKRRGKTVFFSTHIIPDVELICDRVGLINRGRMVAEGTVSELLDAGEARSIEVVVENVSGSFEGGLASEVSSVGAQKLYLVPSNEALGRFVSEVLQRRGKLVSVNPRREGLENLVVRLLEQDRAAA